MSKPLMNSGNFFCFQSIGEILGSAYKFMVCCGDSNASSFRGASAIDSKDLLVYEIKYGSSMTYIVSPIEIYCSLGYAGVFK